MSRKRCKPVQFVQDPPQLVFCMPHGHEFRKFKCQPKHRQELSHPTTAHMHTLYTGAQKGQQPRGRQLAWVGSRGGHVARHAQRALTMSCVCGAASSQQPEQSMAALCSQAPVHANCLWWFSSFHHLHPITAKLHGNYFCSALLGFPCPVPSPAPDHRPQNPPAAAGMCA
jgi:hypothetical protein